MSDETKSPETELAKIIAAAMGSVITREFVEERLAALDAHWCAKLTAQLADQAWSPEWQEAFEGRCFARNFDLDEKRREEDRAFLRVSRLVDVAKYFADAIGDDEHDDMAVDRAARLIALCEAEEARR